MAYKRLKLISSLVNKGEKILDIGTDHCFVPIFLLENNITNNISASDIADKPLGFAKKNLKKKGFQESVKLIKSNGFQNIDISQYDVIIIAGMGGKTISKIISSKPFNGRYIIHSTTSLPEVRKTIEKIGMSIFNEIIIKEGKIFNIIMEVVRGKESLSKKEMYMGPSLLKKNYDYTKKYYEFLLEVIINNSLKSKDEFFEKEKREWLEEKLWKNKN